VEGDCGIADDQAAGFSGIVLLTTFALRQMSTRSPQRRRVRATVDRPGEGLPIAWTVFPVHEYETLSSAAASLELKCR